MSEPPEVQGVTMTSSPGSGLIAPMQVCIAAVPDVTETAWRTPCLAAKASSKARTFGPLATFPEWITSARAATSSSPKSWVAPNGRVRTGCPPSMARRSSSIVVTSSSFPLLSDLDLHDVDAVALLRVGRNSLPPERNAVVGQQEAIRRHLDEP